MTSTRDVDHIDFNLSASAGASRKDDASVVLRLKASRTAFLKAMRADARETGICWLREEASYEQIKCLVHASQTDTPEDIATETEMRSVLLSLDDFIDRLSKAPGWARDAAWYDAFAAGAIAEWNTIASQVERDE